MKNSIKFLIGLMICLAVFSVFTVTAQSRKGEGNVTKQERNVGSFSGIDVGGAFEVILSSGTEERVVIETDDNLQEYVEVKNSGGILEFSTKSIRNPTKLKAYVTFVNLDRINASGASSVKSATAIQGKTLKVESSGASEVTLFPALDEFIVEVSGAGEVTVEGTAEKLIADISGAGNLMATRLLCKNGNVEASGAGTAKVNVSDQVNFETSGAGSIRNYYGKTDSSTTSGKNNTVDVLSKGDSTRVKVGGFEVKVVDGDSTRVTIGNSDIVVHDDGNVQIRKKRKHKFDGHWAGLELGINGYVTKDQELSLPSNLDYMQLRYEKSAEVSINFLEQNLNLINNKLGLVTGVGIRSNNYRFEPNVQLLGDSTPLGHQFLTNKSDYLKSKLVVNYVTIPLILEFQTNPYSRPSSFHMSAGAIMGFRLCSHTKIVENSNGKNKIKDNGSFHMQPFRWDLTARIGWGVVNLYANYSLNSLFLADKGPELYPFTVGVSLVGW